MCSGLRRGRSSRGRNKISASDNSYSIWHESIFGPTATRWRALASPPMDRDEFFDDCILRLWARRRRILRAPDHVYAEIAAALQSALDNSSSLSSRRAPQLHDWEADIPLWADREPTETGQLPTGIEFFELNWRPLIARDGSVCPRDLKRVDAGLYSVLTQFLQYRRKSMDDLFSAPLPEQPRTRGAKPFRSMHFTKRYFSKRMRAKPR